MLTFRSALNVKLLATLASVLVALAMTGLLLATVLWATLVMAGPTSQPEEPHFQHPPTPEISGGAAMAGKGIQAPESVEDKQPKLIPTITGHANAPALLTTIEGFDFDDNITETGFPSIHQTPLAPQVSIVSSQSSTA